MNWLIEKSPENLGGADLNSLVDRFYDEASFLRQLLREVKIAKKMARLSPRWSLLFGQKSRTRKKKRTSPSMAGPKNELNLYYDQSAETKSATL